MKRITLAWALTLCSFITFIACSSPDVGEKKRKHYPRSGPNDSRRRYIHDSSRHRDRLCGRILKGYGRVAIQRDRKVVRHQAGFRLRQRIELHHLPRVDRSGKSSPTCQKAYGLSPKDSVPVDESYSLSIQKRNIYIKATTLEGIYRGITTLETNRGW